MLGLLLSQPFVDDRTTAAGRRQVGCVRGFTLIELMVTLAVLTTITLIAFPSYQNLIQNSRRTAASNDFVVALTYARSQAIEQHASVSVCRSSNPSSATPTCDSGSAGTGWESGWLIFVDADSDGVYNSANGDLLLRQHEAINTGSASAPLITLRGKSGAGGTKDVIVFSRYGIPSGYGSLAICDSRGWGTNARVVQLAAGGRAQALLTTQQATLTSPTGASIPAISSCTP